MYNEARIEDEHYACLLWEYENRGGGLLQDSIGIDESIREWVEFYGCAIEDLGLRQLKDLISEVVGVTPIDVWWNAYYDELTYVIETT